MLTGEICRGTEFGLLHDWGKKIFVKYSSPNFTCVLGSNYSTTKRENIIGHSISRNEELCLLWRNAGGLGVFHKNVK